MFWWVWIAGVEYVGVGLKCWCVVFVFWVKVRFTVYSGGFSV